MFDRLLRLLVQSRKEGSKFVYAVSRTLLRFLLRVFHYTVLDEQFVDGDILMERDEILERLFNSGVGRPDREP